VHVHVTYTAAAADLAIYLFDLQSLKQIEGEDNRT
jgi:hypothetical protein